MILLYHRVAGPRFDPMRLDVAPARFADHLDVLRAQAAVLPLEEFEMRRRAGRLPERAVAVTFDDGYADNLLVAMPLLQHAGVPATIFITAGMVDGAGEFWWDDVERIAFVGRALSDGLPMPEIAWCAEGNVPAFDRTWNVSAGAPRTTRQTLFLALCETLRSRPPRERDARVGALRDWAGVPAAARETHRVLRRTELRSLASVTGVTIGAHTMTHPRLSAQTAALQREELRESRELLAAWTDQPVWGVAYPFGTAVDVSTTTVQAARAAGFEAAFANTAGPAWRWSDRWRVPRYLVRDWDAATFAQKLLQWWAE